MPEAPEVKWVFMVVVIGALYMSKTKTNNGHISQPSRNATLVARQPRGIQAYAPIEGLTASNQKSAEQIMRENKAKKSGMSREDQMELMKSMNPEQQKAYLAKAGIKMGDK